MKELRGEQKARLMEYEQAKATQEKLEGVPPVYQAASVEAWNPER